MSSSHLKWLETIYNQFVSGDKIILWVFLIFFFFPSACWKSSGFVCSVSFFTFVLPWETGYIKLLWWISEGRERKRDKKLMDINTYSFLYMYLYFIYIHEILYNKYIDIIKADYTITNLLSFKPYTFIMNIFQCQNV